MRIPFGATFHPRIVTTPGENWTGRTVTLVIAGTLDATEAQEALRLVIACGEAGINGVVGETTVQAASMRQALPAGQYWLGGALAIPVVGGDDLVVPFVPVRVTVSQSLPAIPAAAGLGSTATCTGVVYDIALSGDGPLVLTVSIPSLLTQQGTTVTDHSDLTGLDAADSHPQSAITGLVSALAAKEATGTADAAIAAHLIAASHISVHSGLTGRDATDAHPQAAITGLADSLAAKAPIVARVYSAGTIANAGTLTIDAALYDAATASVAGGSAITIAISNAFAGMSIALELTLTGTGSVSLTMPVGAVLIGTAPGTTAPGTLLLQFERLGSQINYWGARSA